LVVEVEAVLMAGVESNLDVGGEYVDLHALKFACLIVAAGVRVEREVAEPLEFPGVDVQVSQMCSVEFMRRFILGLLGEQFDAGRYFGLVREELDLPDAHGRVETQHQLLGLRTVLAALPPLRVYVMR